MGIFGECVYKIVCCVNKKEKMLAMDKVVGEKWRFPRVYLIEKNSSF